MKPINSLPPFKRFCVTIGNLPSSYVDSMSYYECIMWLCKYLKDTVIPAVNENAEAVNELINWFNNLDVQDEVNNKLDEMAESGELEEIISSYLNINAILIYNSVADMKSAENLINGSIAKTLHYYDGDDGSAIYKVRTITNEDVVDESMIIALNDSSLIAELVIYDEMNIDSFGAKGDGTTDDSVPFNNALQNIRKINFSNKTYLINDELYYNINKEIILEGNHSTIKGLVLNLNTENKTSWKVPYKANYFIARNIKFKNNGNDKCFLTFQPIKLIDCYVFDYDNFLTLRGQYVDKFYVDGLDIDNHIGSHYALDLGSLGDEHYINNIHIHNSTNNKTITASDKRGIVIQNSLNGYYKFINSNVKFLNHHFENGGVEVNTNRINLTNIEFDNCYFYKTTTIPINDFAYYTNCVILDNPTLNYNSSSDLDYSKMKGFNNIIRSHETFDNINAPGTVIFEGTPTLNYSGNAVLYSIDVVNGTGKFNAEKTSYSYTIFPSIMKEAINGSNFPYSKKTGTVNITNTTDCIRLNGVDNLYTNCYIHLYRKNNNDNTIKKAVLYNRGALLFDYGTTVSGIKWEDTDSIPNPSENVCTLVNGIVRCTNPANLNGSGYVYIDGSTNTVKYKN